LYYLLVGFVYFADRGPRVFTDIPYWSFFFFIFNFWESFGLKIHPALGTLWSLAIEEQFYILGPLIFFFLRRNQLALITGLIIVLSPFLRLMLILNSSVDVWRFTPARLDGISLGILLAIIFSSPNIITVLLTKIRGLKTATLFFFVVTLISRSILPGLYWNSFGNTLIILSFGLSLTMVVLQSMTNQNNRVLNSTVLRYLGLRCYSIYLFHILFMLITRIIVENFMVGLVIQYVLTLGFAHLSWKYIEIPPIKLGRKLTY
jgi:peptidoglycan/LPS O-acetylase OafA/YrhL